MTNDFSDQCNTMDHLKYVSGHHIKICKKVWHFNHYLHHPSLTPYTSPLYLLTLLITRGINLCYRRDLWTYDRSFRLHLTRFERIWKNQELVVSNKKVTPKSLTFGPLWYLGIAVTSVIRECNAKYNMHQIADIKYYRSTCSNCIQHVQCRITLNWQHVTMFALL